MFIFWIVATIEIYLPSVFGYMREWAYLTFLADLI